VKTAPARALARRAIGQRQREGDQRRSLREHMAAFLSAVPLEAPTMPEPIFEGIAALAEFVARSRSPVLLDPRGEIDYIPAPEGPGRLAKQLALFAQALAAVHTEPEVGLDSYLTAYQVAQDTLPAQRRVMLEVLVKRPDTPTTTDIADATRYPTNTARRYLHELAAIQLARRLPGGQGHPDRWEPSALLRELLNAMKLPLSDRTLTSCVRGV